MSFVGFTNKYKHKRMNYITKKCHKAMKYKHEKQKNVSNIIVYLTVICLVSGDRTRNANITTYCSKLIA